MIRPRHLLITALIVALVAAVLPSPIRAQEETTIVFQANLTVPIVGTTALGTLTITADPKTGEGVWFFQGTINGQFATASGTGTYRFDESTITLSMTSIDEWQMPGIGAPELPATATLRSLGNLAYVSYGPAIGVPVAISPPIDMSLKSGTYVLTDAGKGSEGVDELPRTGVAPTTAGTPSSNGGPWSPVMLINLMGVGIGLVFAAVATLALLGRDPRASRIACVKHCFSLTR